MQQTYNPSMFKSNFDELRRRKSYIEKRDLPLRVIAEEAGLSFATVQRVNKGDIGNMSLSTLDSLCRFFGVKSLSELVEYAPDESEKPQT